MVLPFPPFAAPTPPAPAAWTATNLIGPRVRVDSCVEPKTVRVRDPFRVWDRNAPSTRARRHQRTRRAPHARTQALSITCPGVRSNHTLPVITSRHHESTVSLAHLQQAPLVRSGNRVVRLSSTGGSGPAYHGPGRCGPCVCVCRWWEEEGMGACKGSEACPLVGPRSSSSSSGSEQDQRAAHRPLVMGHNRPSFNESISHPPQKGRGGEEREARPCSIAWAERSRVVALCCYLRPARALNLGYLLCR